MTFRRDVLLDEISRRLSLVEREYQSLKGIILREKDLQCLVYKTLAEIPELMTPRPTRDPLVLAPSIHAELGWFATSRITDVIPDITITDPANVKIGYDGEAGVDLPSRGKGHEGFSIIFELKFAAHLEGIRVDEVVSVGKNVSNWSKLIRIYEGLGHPEAVLVYFVTVSKASHTCDEFQRFVDSYREEKRFRFVQLFGGLKPCGRHEYQRRITSA